MATNFKTDAMFFAAHPDDGELLAGGLMARMAKSGAKVVLADATRGEMGTRGTAEIRAKEAENAARILGVERINLELKDGRVGLDTEASVFAVVKAIREHRPRLVFTHTGSDHHPDHNGLHEAVRRGFFNANLLKYETAQERHAPRRLHYFWSHRTQLPPRVDYIADITDFWEQKIASIKAHKSQFSDGSNEGPQTFLTGDLFWHRLEARFAYFGSLINVRYAEPYLTDGLIRVDNPLDFPDVKDA